MHILFDSVKIVVNSYNFYSYSFKKCTGIKLVTVNVAKYDKPSASLPNYVLNGFIKIIEDMFGVASGTAPAQTWMQPECSPVARLSLVTV